MDFSTKKYGFGSCFTKVKRCKPCKKVNPETLLGYALMILHKDIKYLIKVSKMENSQTKCKNYINEFLAHTSQDFKLG